MIIVAGQFFSLFSFFSSSYSVGEPKAIGFWTIQWPSTPSLKSLYPHGSFFFSSFFGGTLFFPFLKYNSTGALVPTLLHPERTDTHTECCINFHYSHKHRSMIYFPFMYKNRCCPTDSLYWWAYSPLSPSSHGWYLWDINYTLLFLFFFTMAFNNLLKPVVCLSNLTKLWKATYLFSKCLITHQGPGTILGAKFIWLVPSNYDTSVHGNWSKESKSQETEPDERGREWD